MTRKLTALIIACVMVSALLCGCAKGAEEPKEYIGIISAMDNEIDLLLKEAEIDRVDTVADVKYHVGSLHGQPVVITRSGIGKIRAASGVTTRVTGGIRTRLTRRIYGIFTIVLLGWYLPAFVVRT